MLEKPFSHVPNFTGYMAVVYAWVEPGPRGQRILDVPTGNGILSERLRERGHQVTRADINRAQEDYVYADLNERLPFADSAFDTCLCLEGIEHVVNSAALIQELCRVTKPGGRIVLSLPNVQNLFSRLHFLCMGCFYQFTPWMCRQLRPGESIDRGHISPLSYLQLRYLFELYGARLTGVQGDRWKKKWLIPFVLPFLAFGWIWARLEVRNQKEAPADECRAVFRDLFSRSALFSRSIILRFERKAASA